MFGLLKMALLYKRIKNDLAKCPPFLFHPYNELGLRSVNRQEFIVEACKNKRVLHFGFLDSPLLEDKIKQNNLLHQEIRQHASFLFGVDVDEKSLNIYRDVTGDFDNVVADIQEEIDCPQLINNFELILLPEVLEHVANPGRFLTTLRKICVLNNNAKLYITVPNAFSIESYIAAMNNFEYVHPEHYYYFSPRTLSKLLSDCGYRKIDLIFYAHGYMKIAPALTKNGIIALCEP